MAEPTAPGRREGPGTPATTALVLRTRDEEETLAVGRRIGGRLQRGDLVILTGELGVGKSVLARGIAAGCGAGGYMASPTFTLIREYAGPIPVYHVDLYRLDPREAADLGVEELLEEGVTVIEWGEKADGLARGPLLRVHLEFGEADDERVLRLEAQGPGPAAAVAAVQRELGHNGPGEIGWGGG